MQFDPWLWCQTPTLVTMQLQQVKKRQYQYTQSIWKCGRTLNVIRPCVTAKFIRCTIYFFFSYHLYMYNIFHHWVNIHSVHSTLVWYLTLSFILCIQLVVRGTRRELLLDFNVVDVCLSVGVSSSLILFPNEMRSLFTILYFILFSILSLSLFVCFGLYTQNIEHSRFACARALKCNVI